MLLELVHQENLPLILFLWHMGDEIPCIPNKKEGGFCFGGKIAPIFFNTLEDSGAFPIEMDVSTNGNGSRNYTRTF
jgi:aconitate hydratase 2/2-methylisocitrate dehydratase